MVSAMVESVVPFWTADRSSIAGAVRWPSDRASPNSCAASASGRGTRPRGKTTHGSIGALGQGRARLPSIPSCLRTAPCGLANAAPPALIEDTHNGLHPFLFDLETPTTAETGPFA